MAEDKNKIYLGDGAYVEFNGWDFIISTDRSGVEHWIALDPPMVERLREFKRECFCENAPSPGGRRDET